MFSTDRELPTVWETKSQCSTRTAPSATLQEPRTHRTFGSTALSEARRGGGDLGRFHTDRRPPAVSRLMNTDVVSPYQTGVLTF